MAASLRATSCMSSCPGDRVVYSPPMNHLAGGRNDNCRPLFRARLIGEGKWHEHHVAEVKTRSDRYLGHIWPLPWHSLFVEAFATICLSMRITRPIARRPQPSGTSFKAISQAAWLLPISRELNARILQLPGWDVNGFSGTCGERMERLVYEHIDLLLEKYDEHHPPGKRSRSDQSLD
jgi:hypothetical protein